MARVTADLPRPEGVKLSEAVSMVVGAWRVMLPAVVIAAVLGWVVAASVPKVYRASADVYLTRPELFTFQNKSAVHTSTKSSGAAVVLPVAFEITSIDSNTSAIATFASSAEEARIDLDGVMASLQQAYPNGGGTYADLQREIFGVERSIASLRTTETKLVSLQNKLLNVGREGPAADEDDDAITPYVEALILLSDAILVRNKRLLVLQNEQRVLQSGIVKSAVETRLESGADANFAAAVCAAIAAVIAANIVLFRNAAARIKG